MKAESLLGVMVLAFAAVFLLSDRPFFPASLPRIEHIADLPDSPAMADVRAYTEYGSGFSPRTGEGLIDSLIGGESKTPAETETDEGPPPLKLGHSYREISFVRLPLFAREEFGLVTYFETPGGYQFAILGPEQIKIIEQRTGQSIASHRVPIWEHLWGWLIALGFIAVLLLQLREYRRWREAEGYL